MLSGITEESADLGSVGRSSKHVTIGIISSLASSRLLLDTKTGLFGLFHQHTGIVLGQGFDLGPELGSQHKEADDKKKVRANGDVEASSGLIAVPEGLREEVEQRRRYQEAEPASP